MKFTRSVFLLFALSAFFVVNAQTPKADDLVQKMFDAVKSGDEKTYILVYPNGEQTGRLMIAMVQQRMQTPEYKKAAAEMKKAKSFTIDSAVKKEIKMMSGPDFTAAQQEDRRQAYHTLRKSGEQKGVNWQDVELLSFTLDSSLQSSDVEKKAMMQAGIKTAKGVVDFRSAGVDFQMSFYNLLYLPAEGGWFGNGFTEIIRKGQEKFTQQVETKMIELSETVNDVPPPPPPPAKNKAKVKTTATKTKTKTKS